jgi:Tfp pilus assembly protein PilW
MTNIRFKFHPTPCTLQTGGFTLVELTIASAMFITATLIIVGAIISLESASRKARATRVAFDNVGAAMDSMSRTIRMGGRFHCDVLDTSVAIDQPKSCPVNNTGSNGATSFVFENQGGDTSVATDQYVYRLNAGSIERSTNGGATYIALTAPEITITTLKFWVDGTTIATDQPYVTILVRGTASTSAKTYTTFDIQTTISQRTPNLF